MFIELMVNANDVNVPLYVNASLGNAIREIHFVNFNTVPPPESDFTIPQICHQ